MPVTRESPVTRAQHVISSLITFNQFLPHFREIVCQHDRPHYGSGPEAEAGAAYLIPVAQVTYVPHVPQGVARAVTHRQKQVTVERWYPHAFYVYPTWHIYVIGWIGAGPVATPSPQVFGTLVSARLDLTSCNG